jgi:hypothetical protein
MSSAIDFDFNAVRMQVSAWQTGAKERLLPERLQPDAEGNFSYTNDYRQQRAATATQEDMPYKPEEKGCCGFMQERGPPGRIIEFVSFWLSLFCLLGIVIALGIANTLKDEHGQYSRRAEIRLSKEVLMFTNETEIRPAGPDVGRGQRETVLRWQEQHLVWHERQRARGFHLAFLGRLAHLPILCFVPVCTVPSIFARHTRKPRKTSRLYKPWLGPDFSRWMEYLFTSPFQIFIVSTAFGFANRDTVLGRVVQLCRIN